MPCEKLSTSSFSHCAELEELEHLVHALADAGAVEAVEPAVEAQELAGGELLVDERAIGNEAERRFRRLRLASRGRVR